MEEVASRAEDCAIAIKSYHKDIFERLWAHENSSKNLSSIFHCSKKKV